MTPSSTRPTELILSDEINDRWLQLISAENELEEKGGEGSGHFGHGGRSGQRGGSAPGRGYPLDVGVTGNDAAVDKFLFGDYGDAKRNQVKLYSPEKFATFGSRVSEELDVDSAFTARVEYAWENNATSDYSTLQLHRAAAEEFGLESPKWINDKIAEHEQIRAGYDNPMDIPGRSMSIAEWTQRDDKITDPLRGQSESEVLRRYVRSAYNETQANFESRGIEEVNLFRGVRTYGAGEAYAKGDTASLAGTGAIASWSGRNSTARHFASIKTKTEGYGDSGIVMAMKVPVSRVLCVGLHGFGVTREREMVVMTHADDEVRIAQVHAK